MEGGNSGGLRPLSELYILPILLLFVVVPSLPILNFLTDIKIRYNEDIVGYIISYKHLCAKNILLDLFLQCPPPLA